MKRSVFREFTKITVFKIGVNEGEGVEGDPITRVYYYITEDGKIIGSTDYLKRDLVLDKTL